jgi:signal transduction histidine kinase
MELVELRHMQGVQGNFGVSESEYMATATLNREKAVPILIYSNVKQIVKQEQFVFQTLWQTAVPADQRIEEIENGKEHEFLEVCSDRMRAAEVYAEFAGLAKKEAQLILPNSKALQREYDLGILHKLAYAAANRKAAIRIICPLDESNKSIAKWLMDNGGPTVQFLNGDVSESTILVVDRKLLFRAELRSDMAAKFPDAIGYSVYSNSRPTVNSFNTFFEMLWSARLLAEKLREADRLQREFIHVAAHELRSPIQPILGMAELIEFTLQNKNDDSSSIKLEEIELIARNARRLQKLSEDILEIARIERNSLTLHKSIFNLNDVLSTLVEDCKKQIELDHRDVKILYKPCDIKANADKERIMQVLGNLLTNALKFTEEGTIIISAQIANKNYVLVRISDTGSGIDKDLLPRLFTKFATKSEHGTGLGLFICKSIVEAHGGKIWADNNNNNKDGIGAAFSFSLPIRG